MHCTKIAAKFEFGGRSPPPGVRTPKNVAFGYNVEKISVGCLVYNKEYALFSLFGPPYRTTYITARRFTAVCSLYPTQLGYGFATRSGVIADS